MQKKTKVAIAVPVAVVAIAAAALTIYAMWMGTPTKGQPIPAWGDPKTALIVVDLQEDFTGPNAVRRVRNADRTVLAAGRMVATSLGNGELVVYIRNIIEDAATRLAMGGMSAPDEPGSRMDSRLPSLPSIKTFTKSRGDAFSNPDLDAWLRENHVDHVTIVGLDAFFCIDDTIHGALNRGYKVTAVLDAITTGTDWNVAEIADKWRAAGVEIRQVR